MKTFVCCLKLVFKQQTYDEILLKSKTATMGRLLDIICSLGKIYHFDAEAACQDPDIQKLLKSYPYVNEMEQKQNQTIAAAAPTAPAITKDKKKDKKTTSSYSRLFNNGTDLELASDIGNMFTHIQSETIKQGNKLEDFTVEFIDNHTDKKVFKEKQSWYKNQNSILDIIDGKEVINKCFIPKTFLEKEGLPCGNKTGTELDFVIIKPDKKIILVEMKAGTDFDTKKSKGEVDSILNIKYLLKKNGYVVEKVLFVSYEAKSIDSINLKTDLKGCLKMTFLQFLKEIFDDETASHGKQFVQSMFKEEANKHLLYFKNTAERLLHQLALAGI